MSNLDLRNWFFSKQRYFLSSTRYFKMLKSVQCWLICPVLLEFQVCQSLIMICKGAGSRRLTLNEREKVWRKNLLHMSLTPVSHMSWQLRSDTPAPGQVVECVITACQSRRAEPVMQIEFSFHPYIMDCLGPSAMRRTPHCLYTCMGTLFHVIY